MCLGWFFDFDEKSGVVPGLLLFKHAVTQRSVDMILAFEID